MGPSDTLVGFSVHVGACSILDCTWCEQKKIEHLLMIHSTLHAVNVSSVAHLPGSSSHCWHC